MAEATRSSGGALWAIGVALALVLYPLSIGPAVALFVRSGEPPALERVFTVIYAPVGLLDEVPIAADMLQGYLKWWYEGVGGRTWPGP
jgi:hypothetical protein